LANIVGDVDSLHVQIDNLNDHLVGFCFIRNIDISYAHIYSTLISASNALHRFDQNCVGCMSPQKLLFCYHLPTRGRAGVKLGDA
jgi:hypothetical protein